MRVFIGVGSNMEPEKHVLEAMRLLKDEFPIRGISTFYLTEADGKPDQPRFYNGVVEIETDIPPLELRERLRRIERRLGRRRTKDKLAPRTIDLDMLVYGDLVIYTGDLTIPDPKIRERAFAAIPLHELSPDMLLPSVRVPLERIVREFEGHEMAPLTDFTERLRRELDLRTG